LKGSEYRNFKRQECHRGKEVGKLITKVQKNCSWQNLSLNGSSTTAGKGVVREKIDQSRKRKNIFLVEKDSITQMEIKKNE